MPVRLESLSPMLLSHASGADGALGAMKGGYRRAKDQTQHQAHAEHAGLAGRCGCRLALEESAVLARWGGGNYRSAVNISKSSTFPAKRD